MSDISEIFKAYDIRGKVGSELNKTVAEKIGAAFAMWLPKEGPVAVGRDMRPDSLELANALMDGLLAQGRDVIDIGEVTSDMIYFAVGSGGLAGGAMITASHNPGEYNGIKFCREEAMPVGEETGLFEIRDIVIKNSFPESEASGKLSQQDVTDEWIQHILGFIQSDKLTPLHIAVDAGNGMAGKVFPHLEKHLPFQVEQMYFELDGSFPNHIANPLEPKNLVDIQSMIKEKSCDAGVAFDGDGDRAVLVDENGLPLTGTVMTALLVDYFLDKSPGATVLLNAICGRAAVDAVKNKSGKFERTRVGHSFIKNDMRKYQAIFAGEHSGHYYFKDNYMADSGLIAAVIALSILCNSGKKLSDLADPYRKAYLQIPETNFEVENKPGMIEAISRAFKDTSTSMDRLDGLTVNFDDGWLNVRPSNTEPLLRLNAEASTQKRLTEIVDQATEILNS